MTVVIVDEAGQDRFYLLCLQTELSGPVLIRRWRRRHWIEFVFRVLKHLLATDSCQAHIEDAYYGHFVLRLMGSFVLFYTSRVICKGRLTMEEIIFSLKHYWRFVDLEPLENYKHFHRVSVGEPHGGWIKSSYGKPRRKFETIALWFLTVLLLSSAEALAQESIAIAARGQKGKTVRYDPSYRALPTPTGTRQLKLGCAPTWWCGPYGPV